jgi:cbb3-type cytochrome oxidase subunit 3
MTMHVNGGDILEVIHVVRIVGSIVMMLVVGLLIWWAVRPSRRAQRRREAIDGDAADNEALWRIVDRMQERLDVLERVLADQVERPRVRGPDREGIFAPADEDRDSGRKE